MESTSSTHRRHSHTGVAGVALSGVVLAAALAAWGTLGDEGPAARDYLVVLGIIALAAAVVFGRVVPRGLRRESAGATALVLSTLGVLTVAVFWSGLPLVLAAGGAVLGLAGWNARTGAWLCRAAVVVAAFALVGDLVVYLGDRT